MTKLLIIGLRRSGTTAFWRWFRADRSLMCFDEPFSEQLMRLPQEHEKDIWAEFRQLYAASPSGFWDRYAPIHRADELRPVLSTRQLDYLNWLLAQAHDVVVETTRCHLKLDQIARETDVDAILHLHRPARAFATSHLLPTRTDFVGRVKRRALQRDFFERSSRYDGWGMETLVGRTMGSALSLLLEEDGYAAPLLYEVPAAARLMVLWDFFSRTARLQAKASLGVKYVEVNFNDFALDPHRVVGAACERLSIDKPDSNAWPNIQPQAAEHRADDQRWPQLEADVRRVLPDNNWWYE